MSRSGPTPHHISSVRDSCLFMSFLAHFRTHSLAFVDCVCRWCSWICFDPFVANDRTRTCLLCLERSVIIKRQHKHRGMAEDTETSIRRWNQFWFDHSSSVLCENERAPCAMCVRASRWCDGPKSARNCHFISGPNENKWYNRRMLTNLSSNRKCFFLRSFPDPAMHRRWRRRRRMVDSKRVINEVNNNWPKQNIIRNSILINYMLRSCRFVRCQHCHTINESFLFGVCMCVCVCCDLSHRIAMHLLKRISLWQFIYIWSLFIE